jgi:ABC-type transport system substrate-binding protein
VDDIAAEYLDSVRNNDQLDLHFRPAVSTYYLGFNNQVAPFNNAGIRQGFSKAINRSEIVTLFFPPGSTIADQLVPIQITPGFTSGLAWDAYDPEGADLLLEFGNYDYSQVINLYYIETTANTPPDSEVIAQYLSEQLLDTMNIRIHPQPLAEDQFFEDLTQGQLGMYLLQVDGYYPDATNFFDLVFIQNASYLGTQDETLISEIKAGRSIADELTRQQYYDVVNRLINTNVPLVPIGYISSTVVNRVTLENVIIGPFNEDFPEMGNLTDQITCMQTSEPYSLNPLDELDRDTLRVATLLYNTLVNYEYGGVGLQHGLADSWSSNDELTEWTFILHYGVTYNNGAAFDANDVVATFSAIWDASSPNHTGRTGEFRIFRNCFGNFLNAQ